jgi:hypothetical protein
MAEHLSGRHRDTLAKVFDHQGGPNVEWREVLSLLEAVGTVERRHNGKIKVTVGPETEVFPDFSEKDVDRQTLVDVRRMLTEAGYAPGEAGTGNERDRDYGDSRWGKPT